MSLSCYCHPDDHEWWYESDENFSQLQTKQRRRCASCDDLINIGGDVLRIRSWRLPKTDIEERIHGEEVPLADKFMCEECAGIFMSLTDLGYCISLGGDIHDDLAEYHDLVESEREF